MDLRQNTPATGSSTQPSRIENENEGLSSDFPFKMFAPLRRWAHASWASAHSDPKDSCHRDPVFLRSPEDCAPHLSANGRYCQHALTALSFVFLLTSALCLEDYNEHHSFPAREPVCCRRCCRVRARGSQRANPRFARRRCQR